MSYDPGGPDRPDPRARRRAPRRGIGAAATMGLVLFAALTLLGGVGAAFAVSTYSSLIDGLPGPTALETIELPEQSVVYDRTGEVELARFGEFNRQVVPFADVPPMLADATTAIEDRTFWENAGFDPVGIIAAGVDALRGRPRGASTITQQLVRQRLLTENTEALTEVTASRKLKEIIQSIRVTQAYPGVEGKQRILAAYLNQNYYGNESYGVAAAAQSYFGIPLSELTLAQAAILAALPQSPSTYDLVANAVFECVDPTQDEEECDETQLVVPADARIVQRRNEVLAAMQRAGGTPLTDDGISDADFEAAMAEPVILAAQRSSQWRFPQFVWQVRRELTTRLCGDEAETCPPIERGGLRVISTLDVRLQGIAAKWVAAATIVPHSENPRRAARALGLEYEPWMANLTDKTLRNGALIAMDYVTGEIVAYQGSADPTATKGTKRFQPRFDVLADGFRQPGSAFKPIVYATGIDNRQLTAATMFMDVVTDFGGGYEPTDADNLERGPVRVRNALQFSLNIPAVKALAVIGNETVKVKSEEMGITYLDGEIDAGLSYALGVEEVRPKDLIRAYGVLGNEGERVYQTTIISATDDTGESVLEPAPGPEQVLDRGAAAIVTDILAGNTDPNVNPFWGEFAIRDGGRRRPATLKTGTNNDAKDLNAYGYIAAPGRGERADGEYALAVGAWNGNSDNSLVSTPNDPLFSIQVTTHVWQGFLEEATDGWSINQFRLPDDLNESAVDPWTGLRDVGGRSITELFIADTGPAAGPAGDLRCGIAVVEVAGYEGEHPEWMVANRGWINRAERGPGRRGGPQNTATAYFYNPLFNPFGRSWGRVVGGVGCGGRESPSPSVDPCASFDPLASLDPAVSVDPSAAAVVCPSPSESVSIEPSVEPTAEPTEEPTEEPTPEPTEEPTPEPTEEPTPEPTEEPPPSNEAESPAG